MGIVGTGLIAHEHARAIAMTGGRMTLAAACDTQADRLKAFRAAHGVARRIDDAAALIADPEVDMLVVATPPAAHEAIVVPALNAGKYVLCEKPLAHSMASAMRIADAAARHPGKLSVSYQLRYYPPFRRLAWLVKNGWIGKVRSALIERHNQIPVGDAGAMRWWGDWGVAGGGALMTQLIHELDLIIQIMGMPQSVSAIADTRFSEIESEDYLEATFRYVDGRTVRCVASVNSGTLNGLFGITGEDGTAGLDGVDLLDETRQKKANAAIAAAVPIAAEPSNEPLARALRAIRARLGKIPVAVPTPHARLYLDIADAIAQARPLPIPATDALASLELCMAAYESALSGKPTSIPLSPKSVVYGGVQAKDYAARACDRNVPSAVFIPRPPSPQSRTVTSTIMEGAKWALANVGVEPRHIKALLRKPPHVHGGPKARHRPWPRRRHIDVRERRAVNRLLRREMLFGDAIIYGGPEETAYCREFARYLGGGYADAVNSGSNALYLALRALELPPGSEVIVPPATDAGGVMPVAMNLCIPVPADTAPGLVNTSVDQIRAVINDRTSAIVVAHIGGHPLDMDPVLALAAERGIPVIEDCAQAHGAVYKGRMVGTLGEISAFSTMFGKHHCTGGQGGIVFTRDPLLFARAKRAADRGKPFGALQPAGNVVGSLNFNQDELSMAFGRVQLAKLPGFLAARRRFAALIEQGLSGVEAVSLLRPPTGSESAYLFLLLTLNLAKLSCDSQAFAQGLELEGIGEVYAGYPVHPIDQPWCREGRVFGDSGIPWSLVQEKPRTYELPNARLSNRSLVRIDIHENLGPREAKDLLTAIAKVVRHYRAPDHKVDIFADSLAARQVSSPLQG